MGRGVSTVVDGRLVDRGGHARRGLPHPDRLRAVVVEDPERPEAEPTHGSGAIADHARPPTRAAPPLGKRPVVPRMSPVAVSCRGGRLRDDVWGRMQPAQALFGAGACAVLRTAHHLRGGVRTGDHEWRRRDTAGPRQRAYGNPRGTRCWRRISGAPRMCPNSWRGDVSVVRDRRVVELLIDVDQHSSALELAA